MSVPASKSTTTTTQPMSACAPDKAMILQASKNNTDVALKCVQYMETALENMNPTVLDGWAITKGKGSSNTAGVSLRFYADSTSGAEVDKLKMVSRALRKMTPEINRIDPNAELFAATFGEPLFAFYMSHFFANNSRDRRTILFGGSNRKDQSPVTLKDIALAIDEPVTSSSLPTWVHLTDDTSFTQDGIQNGDDNLARLLMLAQEFALNMYENQFMTEFKSKHKNMLDSLQTTDDGTAYIYSIPRRKPSEFKEIVGRPDKYCPSKNCVTFGPFCPKMKDDKAKAAVDVPNFAGPCLYTYNEWTISEPIPKGIYKQNPADSPLDNIFNEKYSREIMMVLLMGHPWFMKAYINRLNETGRKQLGMAVIAYHSLPRDRMPSKGGKFESDITDLVSKAVTHVLKKNKPVTPLFSMNEEEGVDTDIDAEITHPKPAFTSNVSRAEGLIDFIAISKTSTPTKSTKSTLNDDKNKNKNNNNKTIKTIKKKVLKRKHRKIIDTDGSSTEDDDDDDVRPKNTVAPPPPPSSPTLSPTLSPPSCPHASVVQSKQSKTTPKPPTKRARTVNYETMTTMLKDLKQEIHTDTQDAIKSVLQTDMQDSTKSVIEAIESNHLILKQYHYKLEQKMQHLHERVENLQVNQTQVEEADADTWTVVRESECKMHYTMKHGNNSVFQFDCYEGYWSAKILSQGGWVELLSRDTRVCDFIAAQQYINCLPFQTFA